MSSAIKTTNIGLNQWQANEFPKRQDFVDDNFKIDAEIKKVNDKVDTIELKAEKVSIADAANKFTATTVEGALLENKIGILELGEQLGVNVQELIQTNNSIVGLLV